MNLADKREAIFLLVEDDEIDIVAIKRAFLKLKIANDLVVTRNGIDALSALRGENGFQKVPRPCIILLDLNMPKMNGIEFLDVVREDPELSSSVIFVLTTSNDDRDRVAAYQRHVAGYVVKAQPADSLYDAIAMLDQYWRVVELP